LSCSSFAQAGTDSRHNRRSAALADWASSGPEPQAGAANQGTSGIGPWRRSTGNRRRIRLEERRPPPVPCRGPITQAPAVDRVRRRLGPGARHAPEFWRSMSLLVRIRTTTFSQALAACDPDRPSTQEAERCSPHPHARQRCGSLRCRYGAGGAPSVPVSYRADTSVGLPVQALPLTWQWANRPRG
jgi:hypothetical protein